MKSRRLAKASQAIKEVVSSTILFHLRDPRIKNVTVIRAEASEDLRSAKVYISVMGDAKTEGLTLKGLESARGVLQAKIADRLQTRHTPVLSFRIDQGVKASLETSRLLKAELADPTERSDVAETVGTEHAKQPGARPASSPATSSPSTNVTCDP